MKIKYLNNFFKHLFFSLLTWFFVRLFIIQVFTVPTNSMNNTFMEGDNVTVNKLSFGARLPITPLSVHIGNTKKYIDWVKVPYLRLFGFTTINRNDVLAFNLPSETQLPVDERTPMIKRCVALPGDFIELNKGDVYVNNLYQDETEYIKWFSVTTNADFTDTVFLKKLTHSFSVDTYTKNNFSVYASQSNVNKLLKLKGIVSVQKKHFSKKDYSPTFFPHSPQVKWNLDYCGLYYIPKKGSFIKLDRQNLILYQDIIETHENNTFRFKGDSVFINSAHTIYYKFKMNYYFLLGDNRYNSIDSRYWGLVPENHIIGIAQ